ncbi:hypothetical protein BGZ68_002754 [Mortierella alpina]|nr:hypothetical protein BGZ68_002754 [Mortierella alpina]
MGNSSSKKRLVSRSRAQQSGYSQVNMNHDPQFHPPYARPSRMDHGQHRMNPAHTITQIREDSGCYYKQDQTTKVLTDMERMRIEAYGASAVTAPSPRPSPRPQIHSAPLPFITFPGYQPQQPVYTNHMHTMSMNSTPSPGARPPSHYSAPLRASTYGGGPTYSHNDAMAMIRESSGARPPSQSVPLRASTYGGSQAYNHNDAMAMIRESSGAYL